MDASQGNLRKSKEQTKLKPDKCREREFRAVINSSQLDIVPGIYSEGSGLL